LRSLGQVDESTQSLAQRFSRTAAPAIITAVSSVNGRYNFTNSAELVPKPVVADKPHETVQNSAIAHETARRV